MHKNDKPDGVYYDLPEEEYHAIPRLSSSGIRNILVSPMTFWARSWMNPKREEREVTIFMERGKAYHARIVEGLEQFNARFAYDLDPTDYPDALVKVDDMKEWIKTYNLANGTKHPVGGNKPELAARIAAIDPEVRVWDTILEQHAKENPGVKMLPAAWREPLESSAAYIERHPTIRHCFTGGAAEVTILWTETYELPDGSGQTVQVPMKARVDRLKSEAIIDLKTYGNALDRSPQRAVTGEVAAHRYHIQVATYYRAEAAAVAAGWLPGPAERKFVFVFQGTGDDPSPIARIMDRRMSWIDLGMRQVEHAALIFDRFSKSHGTDPWIEDSALEHFSDEDFPPWMAE